MRQVILVFGGWEGFAVRGIKLGQRRQPIGPRSLLHQPSEGVWVFDFQGCEFIVGGGPDGPDPAGLDLAEFVAAQIDEFVSEANGYLTAFVVPERFGASAPWKLQGIEFGRNTADPTDVFEVLLVLEGDTYGVWGVRFSFSSTPLDCFYPVQFSRRQR